MNWRDRKISGCLLFLFFSLLLISCQSAVNSHQKGEIPVSEKEDIYRQAINKGYLWLDLHPVGFEDGGCLAILEEIIAFHFLRNKTDDITLKNNYLDEIRKRMDLIALKEDFKVLPKEYTVFLTVTKIAERLGIHPAYFRKIVEDQLISSPLLYSENMTNNIWNTLYLERLGYDPPTDLEILMSQSIIRQELEKRFILQLVNSPINPDYVNPMTLTLYYLTHEIFCLTDFGELPPPSIITNNQAFFSEFFDKTIQWSIAIGHTDLLAELIMNVKMLELKDVPSFQQGVEFILSRQEDNGSFGITNPTLPNIYRHGVLVSIMALSMV
ncbi:MAG: DUF6895 family protein [bacterium]